MFFFPLCTHGLHLSEDEAKAEKEEEAAAVTTVPEAEESTVSIHPFILNVCFGYCFVFLTSSLCETLCVSHRAAGQ